jgi:hypothetical protein
MVQVYNVQLQKKKEEELRQEAIEPDAEEVSVAYYSIPVLLLYITLHCSLYYRTLVYHTTLVYYTTLHYIKCCILT